MNRLQSPGKERESSASSHVWGTGAWRQRALFRSGVTGGVASAQLLELERKEKELNRISLLKLVQKLIAISRKMPFRCEGSDVAVMGAGCV